MNIETIWGEFLTLLREEAGIRVVDTWFQVLSLVAWDIPHKMIHIRAPNSFVKEWVSTHYSALIIRLMSRLLHINDLKVIISADNQFSCPVSLGERVSNSSEQIAIVPAVRLPAAKPRQKTVSQEHALYASYRFDTFVVGPHNSLAYAAAHAIVDKPGSLYNPFFVYGKSGLGKTHLLHAIGNAIRERPEKSKVLYQSANRFVADFINAIRFNKMHHFEAQYKNIDLLLIDDVQFLANKEQTQEAFFHLFNVLHGAQRQIVCTCDSLPGDIAGFADRIRSRLNSGLVTDISEPTLETKIAIVKRKAEAQGRVISHEVAECIAYSGASNIRDIEGALIRVFAYASLAKADLTVELAYEVLGRHAKDEKRVVDMERVVTGVAQHFDFSLEMLRSHRRDKKVVFARHMAMFLMRRMTQRSLRDIGAYLQHRDHSTVLYAIDKIEKLYEKEVDTRRLVELLERRLLL